MAEFQPYLGPGNIERRHRQTKYSNKTCEISSQTLF